MDTTKILVTTALFLLLQLPAARACISPQDPYSAEVLLNKPSIRYNLTGLDNVKNVVDVNPELLGVSGKVFVYRSHRQDNLRVILYESGLLGQETKYLSVRLAPKFKEKDKRFPEPVINFTDRKAKIVIENELNWLKEAGVIQNLEKGDIDRIKRLTQVGRAGFNSRIFYQNGWIPYQESENPAMLRSEGTCSFNLENLEIPERAAELPETGKKTDFTLWLTLGIFILIFSLVVLHFDETASEILSFK